MAVEKAVINQSLKMPVTKPGYQMCSSSFIVEFISAKVEGEEEEIEDNWDHIMIQLVHAFDIWPMNMARIEREVFWRYFGNFDIRIKRVRIKHTFSRIKRVDVYIDQRTKLTFFVKKKQEMKTLQTLSAETISNCVSKEKDFKHLEVPKLLLADLSEAYHNIWRRVNHKCKNCNGNLVDTEFIQCPTNITHKFCFTCCRNFIFYKRHKFFKRDSEVFCPSDERCPLKGSTLPWTFSEARYPHHQARPIQTRKGKKK